MTMLHSKEIEALIDSECKSIYTSPGERAAYRAGLSTAAAACDYVAKEIGQGNNLKRARYDVAKLCGDMLMGLRERIKVPSR